MGGHTSAAEQRVDIVTVSDEPHDDYRAYDPWTLELIGTLDGDGKPISGLPELKNTERGQVIEKEVEAVTVVCPKCGEPARFTHKNEPLCDDCGVICNGRAGKEVQRERQLMIDAKAAGRVDKTAEEAGR